MDGSAQEESSGCGERVRELQHTGKRSIGKILPRRGESNLNPIRKWTK